VSGRVATVPPDCQGEEYEWLSDRGCTEHHFLVNESAFR
jgi:hypothetical protein